MKKKNFFARHKTLVIIACILIVAIIVIVMIGRKNAGSALAEEVVERRDIYTYRSFVGNVEPNADTNIISKVSQQVTELNFELGDEVKKGDLIAVIDSSSVEQNIALKEASLSSTQVNNSYSVSDAQRNYEDYKYALENGLNSSINSAQTSVSNAYASLTKAQTEYNTLANQIENGTYAGTQTEYENRATAQAEYDAAVNERDIKQQEYDAAKLAYETAVNGGQGDVDLLKTDYENAEAALENAQTNLLTAENNLTVAKENFTTAKEEALSTTKSAMDSAQTTYNTAVKNLEIAQYNAEQQLETYRINMEKTESTTGTTSSQLELQNLKDSLEDYSIYAPCDGIITALNITEGGMVSNGASVATISNLNTLQVTISIDEYSILDISEGSPVTILIDSIDKSYEGVITYVSDIATLSNGVSYFEATVDFTADEYVKSGMSAEVRLTSTDEKDVVSVTVEAVHYNDDNTAYVLVKTDKGQEMRNVKIGVSDGSYVEIISGLNEGDIILVTPTLETMQPAFGPGGVQ